MADDEDLRFTMELKDEFTEVFNKIKDTVAESVPKIKASIGGLGKALAVVGGGLAIGGAVYGAWTMFKNKIADVTKEAEKLENTLGNILGSKGAARNVLQELANSDLTKVFKIKEIDEGYTTLANHGLKATLGQMKAIGDLSAGTGKDFNQVIDAIISGGEGKIQGLQNLGIGVVKNRNKKEGIDNLTLSFRGQTETIQNNSKAIQDYLLKLGTIPGVQGSMARSADTVAASENNLSNQVTKLWENLGERFNPATAESKVQLSKFVGTIADFFAIPAEKKIQDQADKLQTLKVKLSETNPKTKEWYGLLQDINDINPEFLKGLDLQKTGFEDIAKAIDKGSDALMRQKALILLNKDNSDFLNEVADARVKESNAGAAIANLIATIDPSIANSKKTQDQMISEAIAIQTRKVNSLPNKGRISSTVTNSFGGSNTSWSDGEEVQKLNRLKAELENQNQARMILGRNQWKLKQFDAKKAALGEMMGLNTIAGNNHTCPAGYHWDETSQACVKDKQKSIDDGGIASVHGGGQIKNVTINIQNLVSGGVNVHTTTLKEGVSKAKDIVMEGLLTAVNDANLVGS